MQPSCCKKKSRQSCLGAFRVEGTWTGPPLQISFQDAPNGTGELSGGPTTIARKDNMNHKTYSRAMKKDKHLAHSLLFPKAIERRKTNKERRGEERRGEERRGEERRGETSGPDLTLFQGPCNNIFLPGFPWKFQKELTKSNGNKHPATQSQVNILVHQIIQSQKEAPAILNGQLGSKLKRKLQQY